MESTREERMQQRLRGAQRQVKDVDFGFMLPALAAADAPPSAPSPAPVNPDSLPIAPPNPATPQPEAPPPPSSQTPATASRSRGRPSNILGIQSANVPRSSTGNDANTSAKRRKLETDEPPSSSTRSMRSSVRQDIYAIPDDDEAPPRASFGKPNLTISQEVMSFEAQISTPVPVVEEAPAEPIETLADAGGSNEVEVEKPAEEVQPNSGALDLDGPSQDDTAVAVEPSKARKPAGRPPRNKRKRDEPVVAEPIAAPVAEPAAANQSFISEVDPLSTSNDKSEDAPAQELRRSRRRSSDQIEQTDKDEQDAEGVEEQAEAIDDHEAAARLNKYRGRRVSRNVVTSDSPVAEDEHRVMSPVVRKKGRPRQVISPVRQRQPAPPKAKSQKAEKAEKPEKASRKRKVREGSPIPVMVHRLTSGPVYNEDESDADILNSEIPCAKRAGVNSVDVLSQICQELVTAGLETLGENMTKTQDAALRLEYKTKIKAVENFTRELNVRLLEHTINLDNAYALEKRLREGQKKKLLLREEILRVRAEREKVALRMDEIRIAHEKESNEAHQRESLNRTAHDIELALDRGRSSSNATDGGKPNIEIMLKRLAATASSKSDSGGILKQIKAFNAFMERAALVLEGRKSG
ncbi:AT hook domain-containing protein [Rutstroemia sp. NJR-2017a BBW]|nr:AT hook domain-containing protein [Rutstroemia sp. NJR-2017a BBW]